MRNVLAFLIALLLAVGSRSAVAAGSTAPFELDALFQELKQERNEVAAKRISGSIAKIWENSNSGTIDLLMDGANIAAKAEKYDVALDLLDQVVMLDPAFAEGWNRRATVHFLMKNYAKSMSDISHVLELEPRHFNAYSGMAAIFRMRGEDEKAMAALEKVLEFYPMLRDAQKAVGEIADKIAGQGI